MTLTDRQTNVQEAARPFTEKEKQFRSSIIDVFLENDHEKRIIKNGLIKRKLYRVEIRAFLQKALKSLQGVQDHFLCKEMLISHSIFKLHKNP